ncbi:GNAT family N-acetyltransferase [Actinosynnema sp. NPDC050436]|uniref:GNAT family N-acetyltransferase n=1 Tax=Actinosynnema sp. NPDC050436 TaxID=3155659 RepID=UPI003400CA94
MELSIERATREDADEVLRLRRGAEDWLAGRNIEQWRPGGLSVAEVGPQIDAGQWYVARSGDAVCGAFRLLWSDEPVWRAENAFAAYVHGLVTDRRYAGAGLGGRLLAWVAEHGRRAGAALLRLDCVKHNERLRRYYADLGFREVGERTYGGGTWVNVLLEKAI